MRFNNKPLFFLAINAKKLLLLEPTAHPDIMLVKLYIYIHMQVEIHLKKKKNPVYNDDGLIANRTQKVQDLYIP